MKKKKYFIDELKGLGNLFIIPVSEATDFYRGTERKDKTTINGPINSRYQGKKAIVFKIILGNDYQGNEVPEDAEDGVLFNLLDGRQVIYWRKCAPFYKKVKRIDEETEKETWDLTGSFMKPFANEFRSRENNLKVEDILRYCSKS